MGDTSTLAEPMVVNELIENRQKINKSMKAIKIIDNKLNWVDADYPVCMDHEVIIKIKSTAVNRADLAQKAGLISCSSGSK